MVEKPGTAILQGIAPNNPFQMQSCGQDLCSFFQTGKTCNGKCYTKGVVYTAQCTVCPGEVKHTYIGETSRTLYTHCDQHCGDLRSANRDIVRWKTETHSRWMADHLSELHPKLLSEDGRDVFEFRVLSSHRDPLSRQTTEAVRIQQAIEEGKLYLGNYKKLEIWTLNRKGEYFAPRERWTNNRN